MLRIRFNARVDPKSFIVFFALLLGFGFCLIVFITFLIAFFNGYEAPFVFINDYGEAIPELIMFLVLMPFIFYGLYLSYKKIEIR